MKDWVLSNFGNEEKQVLGGLYGKALDGIAKIIVGDIEGAMQICNTK